MASIFFPSGKKALLDAVVEHLWKAMLYNEQGEEIPEGNGYTQGGMILTGARTGFDDDAAWLTFDDVTWEDATFTLRFVRIYDATTETPYALIDLGGNKTGQGGKFTFEMPVADAKRALIRL